MLSRQEVYASIKLKHDSGPFLISFYALVLLIISPIFVYMHIQVANFCSAEDDATFWSRLIQPEAQDQVDVFTCFSAYM